MFNYRTYHEVSNSYPIHIRIIMKFPIRLQLSELSWNYPICPSHIPTEFRHPCPACACTSPHTMRRGPIMLRTFGLLYSVQLCSANSDSKFVQLKLRPISQSSNDSSSLGLDCLNTTGEHQEHYAKKKPTRLTCRKRIGSRSPKIALS